MPTLDSTPFEQFLNTLPESTRNDSNTIVSLTLGDLERLVDASYGEGFGDGFDEGIQADFEAEQEDATDDVNAFFTGVLRGDGPPDEEVKRFFSTERQ